MSAKVSKITVMGFRGATSKAEIVFDTKKSVTLIFGENGTGKSTIADAFDFVCNQGYGSLENYSLGGSVKKYLPALNCNQQELKVALDYGSSAWTATLGSDGPVISPSSGCPDAHILRRKSILKLIEAQPKQRFEELKTFIAVPGIEKSETALRDICRTIQSEYDEAVRAFDQANEALEKLWNAEGRPSNNAIAWAGAEARKDMTQLQAEVVQINKLEALFQSAETTMTTLVRALSDQKVAEGSLLSAETKQKQAEQRQTQQNAQLVKVLQEAKGYIAQRSQLTQCPVCEQRIDSASLVRRLSERINRMQGLVSLIATTEEAKRQAGTKKSLADHARKEFCQKARALGASLKYTKLSEITKLGITWTNYNTLLSQEAYSEAAERQARQLFSVSNARRKSLQACKEAGQKSINQYNAVKGNLDTLKQKATDAKELEGLLKRLKKALEILSQQRKDFVENILASISMEVETLYAKLHPGEGIGNIRFYLKPNAIGSLEIDGQFHETCELPPQAYYSESHLDTLGICVFVALSKHFKTENTLLILDDVLTSIDGPHLDRFMKVLHEQAIHFNQVIVTTHYRPWRDRYRWAKGPVANTQLVELGPWTLKGGLQTGEFFTAVEELKKSLKATKLDQQAAASKGGIVLESLLDFLTLKYRCKIPRNSLNEYTLGDLASGIDSKIGKELRSLKSAGSGGAKVENFLKPMIDECTSKQWIRNSVGCHFSSLGSEVADEDIREFCQKVLELSGELLCGECGTLPIRRPSGSYWECKCGKLELYPLIYPGADPKTVDDEG